MVLERNICPVNARRMKDGPGGQGEPATMLGSRVVVIDDDGFETIPHLKARCGALAGASCLDAS